MIFRRFCRPFPILLPLLGYLALATTGTAAEYTVRMTGSFTFSPQSLQIQQGDTVTWINKDQFDYHNSVSLDSLWDTGDLDYNETASVQFPNPGSFNYVDIFYYSVGMTGTIVVQGGTPGPTLPGLTAPLRGPGGFSFTVTNAVIGQTNIIEASTNLLNWTGLQTNFVSSPTYDFTDTDVTGRNRRYYRVRIP